MVRGCVFPNCSNKMTRNTPQSFHRLPVGNRSVLKKWLGVLQMDTDASVHALRHADYRVCSDHFEREDYCQPHRRRHPIPKHFFLKKYAVPRVKELTDRLEVMSSAGVCVHLTSGHATEWRHNTRRVTDPGPVLSPRVSQIQFKGWKLQKCTC